MGLRSHRSRTYVMDASRAFQLREQVVRRHRLVMAIGGLALIVFASVIVAMVLKHKLGDRKAGDESERELQVRGGWGVWMAWSECTTTCGGGSRHRRRYCNDPEPEANGAPCDGQYELTARCSKFPCPDCSRSCSTGFLHNCSYCYCKNQTLEGSIHDYNNSPVDDVSIYLVSMQWQPIARSNPAGVFILHNVCLEDRVFIFQKANYRTAHLNASQYAGDSTGLQVLLYRLKRHRITTHPQDTTLFQGSTLSLTCRSDTQDVKFEWFKDGNILSLPSERSGSQSQKTARAPELVVNNVQNQDTGIYRCRVLSEGGMVFSRPAIVKVIAQDIDDNCPRSPEPMYHQLPPRCSTHGVSSDVINIGFCPAHSCATHTPPRGLPWGQPLCCGPIRTNITYIECDGWSYPVVQILHCGCSISCGTAVVGERPIAGQVRLNNVLDESITKVQAKLMFNHKVVETSKSGSFTLPLPTNITEVIIDVPAGLSWNPTLQVIPVSIFTHQIQVTLQTKASPIRVHSSKKMVFPIMSTTKDTRPIVSLVLPGGAIVDPDGQIYNGIVDVYTQFLDPRSEDDIFSAPGSFRYFTEEGQVFNLETYGVIIVYVESTNGTKLEINSPVTITFDVGELGLEYDPSGVNQLRNYVLDHDTGQWKITKDHWVCNRPGDCSGKLRSTLDIHKGVYYIMAAKIITNQGLCIVKVSSLSKGPYHHPLPGVQVLILTRKDKHNIHISHEVTDIDGNACLEVPCGYEHVLSAPGLAPSSTHDLPEGFLYANDLQKGTVKFTSGASKQIKNRDGPVHLSSTNSCGQPGFQGYSFQFIRNKQGSHLNYLERMDTLMPVEPQPNLLLSWYRHMEVSIERSACVVRINIKGVSVGAYAIAVSRQDHIEGTLLGTHVAAAMTQPNPLLTGYDSSVCLKVRCPQSSQETGIQSTHVTFHVVSNELQSCHIKYSSTSPLLWEHRSDRNAIYKAFRFIVNQSIQEPGNYNAGGYFRSQGRGNTASDWAMYNCATSFESAAQLECHSPLT